MFDADFSFITLVVIIIILILTLYIGRICHDNKNRISNSSSGITLTFVQISSDGQNTLVYDKATKLVYIETYTYRSDLQHTPYLGPNGKPYVYNTETKKLEEMKEVVSCVTESGIN